MMRWVLVVVMLASASGAAADKLQLAKVAEKELPAGINVQGTFEQAWKFDDKNGTNYIVFSAKRWETPPQSRNAMLYADEWVVPDKGAPKKLLPVTELVEDCPLALTALFHDNALELTDLNKDGVGEITFGYEVGCRSDVSADKYKVLTLVAGTMYILRGQTRFDDAGEVGGGTFTPDPIFKKGPASYLEHAKAVWTRTADDHDTPPKKR